MEGKKFFVMLLHPSGDYLPLDCGEGEFKMPFFETEEEAREAAESSFLGESFGYEVFEIGCGC